jgi:hypothetical protein
MIRMISAASRSAPCRAADIACRPAFPARPATIVDPGASTRGTWRCSSLCWPRTGRAGRRRAARLRGCRPCARAAGPAQRTHHAGRALLAGHGPGGAARRLAQRPLTGRLRVASGRGSGIPESRQAAIRSPARWSRRGRGWRVPVPVQCCRHLSVLAHEQGGAGPASARPRGSAPVHPHAHLARD